MANRPILLTPQAEKTEIYPYRRIWRTALLEIGLLLLTMAAIMAVIQFLRFRPGDTPRGLISLGFALLPLGLWTAISYRGEWLAPQPRKRLIIVLILSGLLANAIGVPLIERLFEPDQWLANAGFLVRIIGYSVTVGLTQEFLKYAAVRYSVWPVMFRVRSDGIAYAMTAAVGYATVLNINLALNSNADLVPMMTRIVENTLSQMAISTVMGYALAELCLTEISLYLVPGALIFAAGLTGFSISLRASLVLSGISTTSTGSNALLGIGLPIFLVIVLFTVFNFLINNADERMLLRNKPEYVS